MFRSNQFTIAAILIAFQCQSSHGEESPIWMNGRPLDASKILVLGEPTDSRELASPQSTQSAASTPIQRVGHRQVVQPRSMDSRVSNATFDSPALQPNDDSLSLLSPPASLSTMAESLGPIAPSSAPPPTSGVLSQLSKTLIDPQYEPVVVRPGPHANGTVETVSPDYLVLAETPIARPGTAATPQTMHLPPQLGEANHSTAVLQLGERLSNSWIRGFVWGSIVVLALCFLVLPQRRAETDRGTAIVASAHESSNGERAEANELPMPPIPFESVGSSYQQRRQKQEQEAESRAAAISEAILQANLELRNQLAVTS